MFLVIVNEAFGYTHEQTLDSDFVTIIAMLREHGYMLNERSKSYEKDSGEELQEGEEWVSKTDFTTGQQKRVKRVKSV